MCPAVGAALLIAGVVGVSASHTPKPVSSYTLKSWQNQPGKLDHADRKPVCEGTSWLVRTSGPRRTVASVY